MDPCKMMDRTRLNRLHTDSRSAGIVARHANAYLLIAVCAVPGCALNDYGFVASNTTRGDGALVIDTYVVGAQLRTSTYDPGISVGYTKRTRIVADDVGRSEYSIGWKFGAAQSIGIAPIAMNLTTLGFEGRAGSSETMLNLGAINSYRMASIRHDQTVHYYLSYQVADPSATIYVNCLENSTC